MKSVKRLIAFAALLLFVGCNSVYDDLGDCPQRVSLKVYSQTPCDESPAYPEEIDRLHIWLFSSRGMFISETICSDLRLSPTTPIEFTAPAPGTYRYVIWGGASREDYDLSALVSRKTTLDEALLQLRRKGEAGLVTNRPHVLFHGLSEPFRITDHRKIGAYTTPVSVNMTRYTNDITFNIKGLDPASSYTVEIHDTNGDYNALGLIVGNRPLLYQTPATLEKDAFSAYLRTMKLAADRKPELVLRDADGKVFLRKYLLQDLILKNPEIKLECDHDFIVDLAFDPHMGVEIRVNGWIVHSYDIDLEV